MGRSTGSGVRPGPTLLTLQHLRHAQDTSIFQNLWSDVNRIIETTSMNMFDSAKMIDSTLLFSI
jgi:hypothetical protein